MRPTGRVAMLGVVVVAGLACGPASSEPGPGERSDATRGASADQGPPPPAPVPGNRCRGRARLVDVRPVAPEERPSGLRPEARGHRLQSLTLEIESAEKTAAERADLCVPGARIEAFGVRQELDDAVGRTVDVELELVGDSEQRHWWLHDLEPPPNGTNVEGGRP